MRSKRRKAPTRQELELALAGLRANLAFYEEKVKEYEAILEQQQRDCDRIVNVLKAAPLVRLNGSR